jgi:hypothetical protein
MPVGRDLIEAVATLLDPESPKTASQIHVQLPDPKPSQRAVRYAVKALCEEGRAQRRFRVNDLTQGPVVAVVKDAPAAPL